MSKELPRYDVKVRKRKPATRWEAVPSASVCVRCNGRISLKSSATGRNRGCLLCHRITAMIGEARHGYGIFHARDEIFKIIPKDMACPHCGKTMILHMSQGARRDVMTLQHNRDGTIQVLCVSCNSKHAHYPEDIFFSVKDGEKYCPSCRVIKPVSDFYKNMQNTTGLAGYCKVCWNSGSWRSNTNKRLKEKETK